MSSGRQSRASKEAWSDDDGVVNAGVLDEVSDDSVTDEHVENATNNNEAQRNVTNNNDDNGATQEKAGVASKVGNGVRCEWCSFVKRGLVLLRLTS